MAWPRCRDRAVLLAHGAGADMHAPTLTTVTDALSAAGIPSLRFRYPYRSAGKKAPDRPAVLLDATRAAVAELARRTKLPTERLVLGGRSMGGRYCSLVAGDADDPVPVPRSRAARLSAARGGQAREGAQRPLPPPHDAGALRERHARLARGEAGARRRRRAR